MTDDVKFESISYPNSPQEAYDSQLLKYFKSPQTAKVPKQKSTVSTTIKTLSQSKAGRRDLHHRNESSTNYRTASPALNHMAKKRRLSQISHSLNVSRLEQSDYSIHTDYGGLKKHSLSLARQLLMLQKENS